MRTYGPGADQLLPAIAATSVYNSNYPLSPIIMALVRLPRPGRAATRVVHGNASRQLHGGTALHLDRMSRNPAVRGGR